MPGKEGEQGGGGEAAGGGSFPAQGQVVGRDLGSCGGEGSENAASISLESHDGMQKRY